MSQTKCSVLLVAALLISPLIPGCSDDEQGGEYTWEPGPVGDLYRDCFEGNEDCLDYEYELFMYLNAVDGPNPNYSYPHLQLAGEWVAGGMYDRVGFDYYEYDKLPEDCGYPGIDQYGWKVYVPEAYVEICSTCYTNSGLAKVISLYGPKDLVEFVYDPEDTLAVYVSRTLLE